MVTYTLMPCLLAPRQQLISVCAWDLTFRLLDCWKQEAPPWWPQGAKAADWKWWSNGRC